MRALWYPLALRWKDYEMRKGFTRKPKADEPATRGKNYITPGGLERLKDEFRFLLTRERRADLSRIPILIWLALESAAFWLRPMPWWVVDSVHREHLPALPPREQQLLREPSMLHPRPLQLRISKVESAASSPIGWCWNFSV